MSVPIQKVQFYTTIPGSSPQFVQVAFNAPVQSGTAIMISFGCYVDATITSAVATDSLGNSYSLAVSSFTHPGGAAIFFTHNAFSGVNVIKVTLTAPGATFFNLGIIGKEYSTVGTPAVDQTHSVTGSATSISTGSVTTTSPNQLLLAAAFDEQGPQHRWLSTWLIEGQTANNFAVVDKLVSAIGAYSAIFTYESGSVGTNTALIATFKNIAQAPNSGARSVNLIDVIDFGPVPDNVGGALIRNPFFYLDGIYVTLWGHSTPNVKPYRSLDNGATWQLLDAANCPLTNGTPFDVVQSGETLWFVYRKPTTNEIIVRPFNMSAGRWGAVSTGGPTTGGFVKAVLRSTGKLVIFHYFGTTGAFGINYDIYDTAGLTWTSTASTLFPSGAYVNIEIKQCLTDPSDTVHVWFWTRVNPNPYPLTYHYQQLSSGNTPNTAVTWNTVRGIYEEGFIGTPSIWGTQIALSAMTYDGDNRPPTDPTSLRVFYFDPYSSTTPTITSDLLMTAPVASYWMWDNTTLVYGSTLRVTFTLTSNSTVGANGPSQMWVIENSGSGWGHPVMVWDELTDQPSQPPGIDFINSSPYNPVSISTGSGFVYLMNLYNLSGSGQLSAYFMTLGCAGAPPPAPEEMVNYGFVGMGPP